MSALRGSNATSSYSRQRDGERPPLAREVPAPIARVAPQRPADLDAIARRERVTQPHGHAEHPEDERVSGYLRERIEQPRVARGLLRREPWRERHTNDPLFVGRRINDLDDRLRYFRWHIASPRGR